MKRSLFAVQAMLAVFLTFFAVGCGPPYEIVKQTTPNPFGGSAEYTVMPVDYAGLMVGKKTEAEYVGGKSDKTADSFEADKQALSQNFQTSLNASAAEEAIKVSPASGEVKGFVIKSHVGFIEPGFYVGVAAGKSHVTMNVTISGPDGAVLDEIIVENGSGAFSTGERLRNDGLRLGRYVARYLKDRRDGTTKK